MILNIQGFVPERSSVNVTCCGQTKTIDSMDKVANFSIPNTGEVEVIIEESHSKSNYTLLHIALFILTALIQGIFNILLMNTDSDWYKRVRAYNIKARLLVDVKEDMCVWFNLSETKYVGNGSIWEHPRLEIEPDVSVEVLFEDNPQSILNECCSYIKRFISVASIVMLIFIVLLYVSVTNGLTAGIIVTAILVVGEIALVFWLVRKEHRRCKELLNKFLNKNK